MVTDWFVDAYSEHEEGGKRVKSSRSATENEIPNRTDPDENAGVCQVLVQSATEDLVPPVDDFTLLEDEDAVREQQEDGEREKLSGITADEASTSDRGTDTINPKEGLEAQVGPKEDVGVEPLLPQLSVGAPECSGAVSLPRMAPDDSSSPSEQQKVTEGEKLPGIAATEVRSLDRRRDTVRPQEGHRKKQHRKEDVGVKPQRPLLEVAGTEKSVAGPSPLMAADHTSSLSEQHKVEEGEILPGIDAIEEISLATRIDTRSPREAHKKKRDRKEDVGVKPQRPQLEVAAPEKSVAGPPTLKDADHASSQSEQHKVEEGEILPGIDAIEEISLAARIDTRSPREARRKKRDRKEDVGVKPQRPQLEVAASEKSVAGPSALKDADHASSLSEQHKVEEGEILPGIDAIEEISSATRIDTRSPREAHKKNQDRKEDVGVKPQSPQLEVAAPEKSVAGPSTLKDADHASSLSEQHKVEEGEILPGIDAIEEISLAARIDNRSPREAHRKKRDRKEDVGVKPQRPQLEVAAPEKSVAGPSTLKDADHASSLSEQHKVEEGEILPGIDAIEEISLAARIDTRSPREAHRKKRDRKEDVGVKPQRPQLEVAASEKSVAGPSTLKDGDHASSLSEQHKVEEGEILPGIDAIEEISSATRIDTRSPREAHKKNQDRKEDVGVKPQRPQLDVAAPEKSVAGPSTLKDADHASSLSEQHKVEEGEILPGIDAIEEISLASRIDNRSPREAHRKKRDRKEDVGVKPQRPQLEVAASEKSVAGPSTLKDADHASSLSEQHKVEEGEILPGIDAIEEISLAARIDNRSPREAHRKKRDRKEDVGVKPQRPQLEVAASEKSVAGPSTLKDADHASSLSEQHKVEEGEILPGIDAIEEISSATRIDTRSPREAHKKNQDRKEDVGVKPQRPQLDVAAPEKSVAGPSTLKDADHASSLSEQHKVEEGEILPGIDAIEEISSATRIDTRSPREAHKKNQDRKEDVGVKPQRPQLDVAAPEKSVAGPSTLKDADHASSLSEQHKVEEGEILPGIDAIEEISSATRIDTRSPREAHKKNQDRKEDVGVKPQRPQLDVAAPEKSVAGPSTLKDADHASSLSEQHKVEEGEILPGIDAIEEISSATRIDTRSPREAHKKNQDRKEDVGVKPQRPQLDVAAPEKSVAGPSTLKDADHASSLSEQHKVEEGEILPGIDAIEEISLAARIDNRSPREAHRKKRDRKEDVGVKPQRPQLEVAASEKSVAGPSTLKDADHASSLSEQHKVEEGEILPGIDAIEEISLAARIDNRSPREAHRKKRDRKEDVGVKPQRPQLEVAASEKSVAGPSTLKDADHASSLSEQHKVEEGEILPGIDAIEEISLAARIDNRSPREAHRKKRDRKEDVGVKPQRPQLEVAASEKSVAGPSTLKDADHASSLSEQHKVEEGEILPGIDAIEEISSATRIDTRSPREAHKKNQDRKEDVGVKPQRPQLDVAAPEKSVAGPSTLKDADHASSLSEQHKVEEGEILPGIDAIEEISLAAKIDNRSPREAHRKKRDRKEDVGVKPQRPQLEVAASEKSVAGPSTLKDADHASSLSEQHKVEEGEILPGIDAIEEISLAARIDNRSPREAHRKKRDRKEDVGVKPQRPQLEVAASEKSVAGPSTLKDADHASSLSEQHKVEEGEILPGIDAIEEISLAARIDNRSPREAHRKKRDRKEDVGVKPQRPQLEVAASEKSVAGPSTLKDADHASSLSEQHKVEEGEILPGIDAIEEISLAARIDNRSPREAHRKKRDRKEDVGVKPQRPQLEVAASEKSVAGPSTLKDADHASSLSEQHKVEEGEILPGIDAIEEISLAARIDNRSPREAHRKKRDRKEDVGVKPQRPQLEVAASEKSVAGPSTLKDAIHASSLSEQHKVEEGEILPGIDAIEEISSATRIDTRSPREAHKKNQDRKEDVGVKPQRPQLEVAAPEKSVAGPSTLKDADHASSLSEQHKVEEGEILPGIDAIEEISLAARIDNRSPREAHRKKRDRKEDVGVKPQRPQLEVAASEKSVAGPSTLKDADHASSLSEQHKVEKGEILPGIDAIEEISSATRIDTRSPREAHKKNQDRKEDVGVKPQRPQLDVAAPEKSVAGPSTLKDADHASSLSEQHKVEEGEILPGIDAIEEISLAARIDNRSPREAHRKKRDRKEDVGVKPQRPQLEVAASEKSVAGPSTLKDADHAFSLSEQHKVEEGEILPGIDAIEEISLARRIYTRSPREAHKKKRDRKEDVGVKPQRPQLEVAAPVKLVAGPSTLKGADHASTLSEQHKVEEGEILPVVDAIEEISLARRIYTRSRREAHKKKRDRKEDVGVKPQRPQLEVAAPEKSVAGPSTLKGADHASSLREVTERVVKRTLYISRMEFKDMRGVTNYVGNLLTGFGLPATHLQYEPLVVNSDDGE
ncbi:titin homolog [Schistocerca nitens]|uniref:titin homolog n=1 Tax=Schistocerca nitens TaxID=7011 RepID=UPI0021181320|nr:titin homolog [Schistocerca nitens]